MKGYRNKKTFRFLYGYFACGEYLSAAQVSRKRIPCLRHRGRESEPSVRQNGEKIGSFAFPHANKRTALAWVLIAKKRSQKMKEAFLVEGFLHFLVTPTGIEPISSP